MSVSFLFQRSLYHKALKITPVSSPEKNQSLQGHSAFPDCQIFIVYTLKCYGSGGCGTARCLHLVCNPAWDHHLLLYQGLCRYFQEAMAEVGNTAVYKPGSQEKERPHLGHHRPGRSSELEPKSPDRQMGM